jgi:hypothetical protein
MRCVVWSLVYSIREKNRVRVRKTSCPRHVDMEARTRSLPSAALHAHTLRAQDGVFAEPAALPSKKAVDVRPPTATSCTLSFGFA